MSYHILLDLTVGHRYADRGLSCKTSTRNNVQVIQYCVCAVWYFLEHLKNNFAQFHTKLVKEQLTGRVWSLFELNKEQTLPFSELTRFFTFGPLLLEHLVHW